MGGSSSGSGFATNVRGTCSMPQGVADSTSAASAKQAVGRGDASADQVGAGQEPCVRSDIQFAAFAPVALPGGRGRLDFGELADTASSTLLAAPGVEKRAMVCRHWKSKGWCRLGSECRFLHPEYKRGSGMVPRRSTGAAVGFGNGGTSEGLAAAAVGGGGGARIRRGGRRNQRTSSQMAAFQ